jgi:hypothetical protein
MNNPSQKFIRVWWVLLAGRFIRRYSCMSVYYGIALQGKNVDEIPSLVAASTPYQLVVIQILLLIIVSRAMKRDGLIWKDIGWKIADGQQLWRELLIGAIPGIVLALFYLYILTPMLTTLQQIWDYVPAGIIHDACVLIIAVKIVRPLLGGNIVGMAARLLGRPACPAVAFRCSSSASCIGRAASGTSC